MGCLSAHLHHMVIKRQRIIRIIRVPDPYAAGVVQGIFAVKLSGMSASGIARILNKNGVLAPSEYKAKCGEKYSTSFKGAGQSKWSAQTVSRILKNVVYIGTLAQGKRTTVSHKVKKEIAVPGM